VLRQADPPPPPALPPLSGAALHSAGEADPLAGRLSVQGLVARAGREGRFDDVVGRGFQLIVAGGDPLAGLDAGRRRLIELFDMSVATLDPDAPQGVRDLDGRLTGWLSEHQAHAVIVRPDFYVFGSVPAAEELPALLDDLGSRLHLTSTPTGSGALA
jgi:3-(3-hydroxy-phenyl)propionate hydroxylase